MNRYEPRSYQTSTGVLATVMERDTRGTYITYASHKQEIESLQQRLKELESNQKDSISISSIIADHVEDALRKSIGETVHQVVGDILKGGLDKYNGDPCHSTVDSILDELAVSAGKTVNGDEFIVRNGGKKYGQDFSKANELTGRVGFTFGSNFGEGRAVFHEMSTSYGNLGKWKIEPVTDPAEKRVVCLSGDGHNFITGAEYFYEVDSCEPGKEPEVIYICSYALVSDLQGHCRWAANKVCGALKYEVKHLNGETCGVFRIK